MPVIEKHSGLNLISASQSIIAYMVVLFLERAAGAKNRVFEVFSRDFPVFGYVFVSNPPRGGGVGQRS